MRIRTWSIIRAEKALSFLPADGKHLAVGAHCQDVVLAHTHTSPALLGHGRRPAQNKQFHELRERERAHAFRAKFWHRVIYAVFRIRIRMNPGFYSDPDPSIYKLM